MSESWIMPKGSILGNLEILEVYQFYDRPCLFSCKNTTGQIFIAVWIDKTRSEDRWLYASVSQKRFRQMFSDKIQLKDVFLNAEDNFVFEVVIPHKEDRDTEILRINCKDLDADKLPNDGELLDYESSINLFRQGGEIE